MKAVNSQLPSAAQFIPSDIHAFLSAGSPLVKARIKQRPEEFRVQERLNSQLVCTVGSGSDLGALGVDSSLIVPSGDLSAVTLVKRGLSTFDAVDQLSQRLGIPIEQITYAGLKDTEAVTGQRLVIAGVSLERLAKECQFQPLNGRLGWFLKDPTIAFEELTRGKLAGNQFSIKAHLEGMSKRQIEAYLQPLLARLLAGKMRIPNAYGHQRLGKRQNNLAVAHTLFTEGIEPAVKRFLLETSDLEPEKATALRLLLADLWAEAQDEAQQKGAPLGAQVKLFGEMQAVLEGHNPVGAGYTDFSMSVEAQLVKRIAQTGDISRSVSDLRQMCSLWAASYQSYWFNQLLSKVLRGEVRLPRNHPVTPELPILQDEPNTLKFYEKYCPEAVPERLNSEASALFLKPPPSGRTSWRPVFATVSELKHWAENGAWNVKFALRSGAYATTLLGMLFQLSGDDTLA